MKTRQEMVYDFMLALAPTVYEEGRISDQYAEEMGIEPIYIEEAIEQMHELAGKFADQYLKGIN